jgi:hypothetical protein
MSANLKINTAPDDEKELQRLLAQQAEIQAEITALLPSSTTLPSSSQFHRSPMYKQQRRRQSNTPQTMSGNRTTISRHLSQVGYSRSCFIPYSNKMQNQIKGPFQIQRNFSQFSASPPLNADSRQENPPMTRCATQKQPSGSYNLSFPAPPLQKIIVTMVSKTDGSLRRPRGPEQPPPPNDGAHNSVDGEAYRAIPKPIHNICSIRSVE